jgi:Na+(H+)/acetate symporter ActP
MKNNKHRLILFIIGIIFGTIMGCFIPTKGFSIKEILYAGILLGLIIGLIYHYYLYPGVWRKK